MKVAFRVHGTAGDVYSCVRSRLHCVLANTSKRKHRSRHKPHVWHKSFSLKPTPYDTQTSSDKLSRMHWKNRLRLQPQSPAHLAQHYEPAAIVIEG